jgi:hypothetical protein
VGDQAVLERMLARLQGYTWAVEVNEGEPGQAAGPDRAHEASRSAIPDTGAGPDGGVFCPIEWDDSWLDAATD